MRSRSGAELPQLELECLAALWALESAPVALVHQRLAERGRPLAYTTVLTVLDRLRRKQAVERRRQGRAYVYRALLSREQMRARALERLIQNYFDSPQQWNEYVGTTVAKPAAAAAAPVVAAEEEEEAVFLD